MKESIGALTRSVLITAAVLILGMLSPAMTETLDFRVLFEIDAISEPAVIGFTDTPAFTPELTSISTQATVHMPATISTGAIIPARTGMATSAPKPTSTALPKLTAMLTESPTTTVTWATWTATTTSVATSPETYTTGVRPSPSSPLLDRLVKNKPSIWGNKGFYVLLGALYLTLLGLFLKQILDTLKRQP